MCIDKCGPRPLCRTNFLQAPKLQVDVCAHIHTFHDDHVRCQLKFLLSVRANDSGTGLYIKLHRCECVYTYIGQLINPFDNNEHFTTQEDMYVYHPSFILWSVICTLLLVVVYQGFHLHLRSSL